MKRLSTAVFLGLAVLVIAGLAPRAEAAKPLVVYVHDNGAPNRVYAFTKSKTGQLANVPGSPFSTNNTATGCGGECQTIAYSSKKKMLFVSGSSGISVFKVAKNGALALTPGSPFGGVVLLGVAVVKKGKNTYVYGSEFFSDQVRGYLCLNGQLLELPTSPYPAGNGPDGMNATKKGCLFVANESETTISAYMVQRNGSLLPAPGSPVAVAAAFIYNCHVGPKGKFLYVADGSVPRIFVFAINKKTCALAAIAGSPFASAVTPGAGLAPSKKQLVAIAFFTSPLAFAVFSRAKTGGLTPLGGAQATVAPSGVRNGAVDSKGKCLVVVSSQDDLVISYTVDKKTGVIAFAGQIAATLSNGVENGVLIIKP